MKVIVNDTTDLQVIDEEGNVLYEWNPPFKKVKNKVMGSVYYD